MVPWEAVLSLLCVCTDALQSPGLECQGAVGFPLGNPWEKDSYDPPNAGTNLEREELMDSTKKIKLSFLNGTAVCPLQMQRQYRCWVGNAEPFSHKNTFGRTFLSLPNADSPLQHPLAAHL